MRPEPTISDFLNVGMQGIVGADKVSDTNAGSDYESRVGPNAILWSRQTQRDTDLFRSTRFNDADGADLTTLAEWRYGVLRTVDGQGSGTAQISRATLSAGTGTVYRGTRIRWSTPTSEPVFYQVTADTVMSGLNTVVPIRAVESGPGYSSATAGGKYDIIDSLWDTTLNVVSLSCSDGTTLESAPVYRGRIRKQLVDNAPGYSTSIVRACNIAGASNVLLFPSDYAGVAADYGLNYAYVGDAGYSASADLIRACTLALRKVRVAGDCLQVLPLVRSDITIIIDVYFREPPASMPIARLDPIYRKSVLKYFSSDGRFTYTLSGIESAIAVNGTETLDVVVNTPTTDATFLVGGVFPQSLPRYFLSDANLQIRYFGPNA